MHTFNHSTTPFNLSTTLSSLTTTTIDHHLTTTVRRHGHTHIHEHNVNVNFAFVIQIIIISLIFLFGIAGNVLVSYTVIRQTQSKHTTWHYLCSLSINDLLVSLISVPIFFYSMFNEDIINDGTFLCQLNGFCLICFFLISVLTLAMISIHKFLYIRRPLYWRGPNQSLKFIALVWFMSIGVAVGPFVGWSKYSHVHGRKQCIPAAYKTALDQSYLTVLIIIGFVLPLFSMLYCYVFIYSATMRHRQRLRKNSITSADKAKAIREWALLKTILIVVVAFCVFWIPFVLYMCFSLSSFMVPFEVAQLAFIMAYAQSAINPIIYALRHKLFRDNFKNIFCCRPYITMDSNLDQSGSVFTIENHMSSKRVHFKKNITNLSHTRNGKTSKDTTYSINDSMHRTTGCSKSKDFMDSNPPL